MPFICCLCTLSLSVSHAYSVCLGSVAASGGHGTCFSILKHWWFNMCFYQGRVAHVLVFCVLMTFSLINVWFTFETDIFGSVAGDSWQPQRRLDISILCKHSKLSGAGCYDSTMLYCPTSRGPIPLRICFHLFIQGIVTVELVSIWAITGAKNEWKNHHCHRAWVIANIAMILSQFIIVYVEGTRYDKNMIPHRVYFG